MVMARRKRNKKWICWLILLAAASVVAYLVWDSYFREKDDGAEISQKTLVQEENKPVESSKNDDGAEDEKKVKLYEGEDPNELEGLSGVITYAGAIDGVVMIRVNIDQYLGGGSCVLSLLNEGVTMYEEVANIVSSASTATCEGFDIPVDQLSNGEYEIVIKIESNGKTGTIGGKVTI